jgi:hypothetical protein
VYTRCQWIADSIITAVFSSPRDVIVDLLTRLAFPSVYLPLLPYAQQRHECSPRSEVTIVTCEISSLFPHVANPGSRISLRPCDRSILTDIFVRCALRCFVL